MLAMLGTYTITGPGNVVGLFKYFHTSVGVFVKPSLYMLIPCNCFHTCVH